MGRGEKTKGGGKLFVLSASALRSGEEQKLNPGEFYLSNASGYSKVPLRQIH